MYKKTGISLFCHNIATLNSKITNAVTSGYKVLSNRSYLKNGIEYLKCDIQAPYSEPYLNDYLLIGYAPVLPNETVSTPSLAWVSGGMLYPTVIYIDKNSNEIKAFISENMHKDLVNGVSIIDIFIDVAYSVS